MKTLSKSTGYLKPGAIGALLVAASLGLPALAQQNSQTNPQAQVQTGAVSGNSAQTQNGTDNSNYATGQPLQPQSKEGFWGHANPFARKKWVKRQLDPVRDRVNELDQLQAKNAKDIKDVDERAQNGIHAAQSTADQANQTASTANTTAQQAQQEANKATTQTAQLTQTVDNLDQFRPVNNTEIRFRPGTTTLNTNTRQALDQVVSQLQNQKGYVVEVEGFSRLHGAAGIRSSQQMADSVVRYMVEHQVPVYRIHELAMGNAKPEQGEAPTGSVVRVTLMENSLAALNSPNGESTNGATQPNTAQPSPQGAASQPPSQQ